MHIKCMKNVLNLIFKGDLCMNIKSATIFNLLREAR